MTIMTLPEAARALRVSTLQLRLIVKEGRLPGAYRLGGTGHWRIPVAAIEEAKRVWASAKTEVVA